MEIEHKLGTVITRWGMPKCALGAAEPPWLPCQQDPGTLPEYMGSPSCSSGRSCWHHVCARGCDIQGTHSELPLPSESVCVRGLPVPPQDPGSLSSSWTKWSLASAESLQQRGSSVESLRGTPCPWVNCRECCLQTVIHQTTRPWRVTL